MNQILHIDIDQDPLKTSVRTEEGKLLEGITRIDVSQEGPLGPLKVSFQIELLHLHARVYADQCDGKLDGATTDMLHRLPSNLIANLAKEMAQVARDARDVELEMARQRVKTQTEGGESL